MIILLAINAGAMRIVDSYDGSYGTIQIYSGTTWSKICWTTAYALDMQAYFKLENSLAKFVGQNRCIILPFFDDSRPLIEPYINIPYICISEGDARILSRCLPWQKQILSRYCTSRTSAFAICTGMA